MRNLNFKYARAENFLCFGEEGIEVNFESYGNIVAVKGRNLDVMEQDGEKASNGSGKCFGLNTQILMYDGTVKMVQDIVVGDLVMGNDSTPRKVLTLGRGREPLYEIKPIKGDSYIVNKSHILTLKSSDKKYNRYKNQASKNGNVYNISVEDYLAESKSYRHIMHGYRAGVEFSKKELIIEPYFLGLWLGDGTRTESSITNTDAVVVKEVKNQAAKRSLKFAISKNDSKSCPTYRISSFIREKKTLGKEAFLAYQLNINGATFKEIAVKLKEILPYYANKNIRASTVWRWVKYVKDWIKEGKKLPKIKFEPIKLHEMTNPNTRNSLFNDLKKLNLIDNKHVPLEYMTSSREDRLQILAGYLDTDGYFSKGRYEFVSKFKKLAEDITYVARSLGLACYFKKIIKSSQNGTKGTYYRGFISGDCSVIPVKILYKKSHKSKINKDPLVVGIKIKSIGIDDYYGFAVDGNHLFLLGDFTVVHNSSIPEIIVYGLYGKTVKKPKKLTHLDLINNKTGKKSIVEVRWDDYRIVRTRDTNNVQTLKLWKSAEGVWNKDTEVTKGKGTQAEIEKAIGLTYESFMNIFIFSDDNTHPFLECDSTKKREIVENILSLEKYRTYSENAKEATKALKTKIKDLIKEYEFLDGQEDSCVTRVAQIEKQELDWFEKCRKELEEILNEIKKKRDQLEKSDGGAALALYNEAQEQIVELKKKIPVLEEEKTRLSDILTGINDKYSNLLNNIKESERKVETLKNEHSTLSILINHNEECINDNTNKINKECPYCLGIVNETNLAHILEKAREVIKENEPILAKKKEEYTTELANLEKFKTIKAKADLGVKSFTAQINKINSEVSELHCGIAEFSKVNKPDSAVTELLLADQIESLKKKAHDKQEERKGVTPYETIKQTAIADLNQKISDCKKKQGEVKESEDLLPYYEFWVKAFGDTGIRKYVIENIIPTLNDRIEYWLQFLIDNKIKLTFNSMLEETIDRYPFNGRPYVYHGMSGGQRRRLNLTIAAAWAFVSALNSGASPSQIWLDEVTMNVDAVGVHGIYRMICELAKEKQVFVIDHNEALLEMLNGCDTIHLEMTDEVSKKIDTVESNC